MDEGDYEPVLHGLLRKRAILAGEVEALRCQMGDKLSALDHIDATIRIFRPGLDLDDLPQRPAQPPNAAFRGEVQRFLLDTLRKAPEPLTTFQLAEAIMVKRGLATTDRVMFKLIAGRTGHSLGRLRTNGFVASERVSKGALLRWRATGHVGQPGGEWRNGS